MLWNMFFFVLMLIFLHTFANAERIIGSAEVRPWTYRQGYKHVQSTEENHFRAFLFTIKNMLNPSNVEKPKSKLQKHNNMKDDEFVQAITEIAIWVAVVTIALVLGSIINNF